MANDAAGLSQHGCIAQWLSASILLTHGLLLTAAYTYTSRLDELTVHSHVLLAQTTELSPHAVGTVRIKLLNVEPS